MKPTFLRRLAACTLGDGGGSVAVALVVAGLGVTIAAGYAAKTKTGVDNGTGTLVGRANQGADGFIAGGAK